MNKRPQGYILLWTLVIILLILVGLTHIIFYIGQGRWECDEWKTYRTEQCETDLDPTTIDEDCSVDYIKECNKEVWTRRTQNQ